MVEGWLIDLCSDNNLHSVSLLPGLFHNSSSDYLSKETIYSAFKIVQSIVTAVIRIKWDVGGSDNSAR
jgi:hypothetical protein